MFSNTIQWPKEIYLNGGSDSRKVIIEHWLNIAKLCGLKAEIIGNCIIKIEY